MCVVGCCKCSLRYLGILAILVSMKNVQVISKKTDNEEKCIWFDECGPDPTPGRSSKTLNCVYNGEPGRIYRSSF